MWMVKKTTTSIVAALAFSGLVSHGAWASEGSALPVANTLSSEDLRFAFASRSEPVELVVLSEQEMQETQGAWGPLGAAGGAVAGAWGYLGYASGCGCESSWGGFAGAVAGGASVGFLTGPIGIAGTIAGSSIAYYGGLAGGLTESAYNSGLPGW